MNLPRFAAGPLNGAITAVLIVSPVDRALAPTVAQSAMSASMPVTSARQRVLPRARRPLETNSLFTPLPPRRWIRPSGTIFAQMYELQSRLKTVDFHAHILEPTIFEECLPSSV